jgi:hypothetical protein
MTDADLPPDDTSIGPAQMWHPAPDLGFQDFEAFVTATFEQIAPQVDDLRVQAHERILGGDGEYDFDATVRFRFGGMNFLVLVEAKCHNHPIKRDVVQVLASKVASVGAQKGVIIATAPFQRGALAYAAAHGIALVQVTEGRFTFESRSAESERAMSRQSARDRGVPDFVGFDHRQNGAGGISSTMITGQPDYALELLAGVDRQ